MKARAQILSLCFILLSFGLTNAQKNTTDDEVKDKVIYAVTRLDASCKFEKEQRNKVEEIFYDFYSGQQKLKNNIQRPASGLAQGLASQDFQSVRKKNEGLIAERDRLLKEELTEEQYKKWKSEIEPTLHKRRK